MDNNTACLEILLCCVLCNNSNNSVRNDDEGCCCCCCCCCDDDDPKVDLTYSGHSTDKKEPLISNKYEQPTFPEPVYRGE